MNWKLIFLLSLVAIPMAFGTVYFIPSYIEPGLWIVIFLFSAYVIARFCSGKYFLNGFMLSIFNCVWITAIQFMLFDAYYKNHPYLAEMKDATYEQMHLGVLIIGPITGIISGLILGLFSWATAKIIKRKQPSDN